MSTQPGLFISFEGIDGAGKSTLALLLLFLLLLVDGITLAGRQELLSAGLL